MLLLSGLGTMAQKTGVDAATVATRQAAKNESASRLRIGGYGEAVMTRNFYSQSFIVTRSRRTIETMRATGDSICRMWC